MIVLTVVLSIFGVFLIFAYVRVSVSHGVGKVQKMLFDTLIMMSKLERNKGKTTEQLVNELREKVS